MRDRKVSALRTRLRALEASRRLGDMRNERVHLRAIRLLTSRLLADRKQPLHLGVTNEKAAMGCRGTGIDGGTR